MTPAVLLVGFCVAMTVIAVGRLFLEDERDPVDVGTALAVLGITLLSVLWIDLREAWLAFPGRLFLATAGLGAVGIGAVVIRRHWEVATDEDDRQTRRADDESVDERRRVRRRE